MSKIVTQTDLTQITDPKSFMRFCSQIVKQIITTINGNLDFNNMRTQIVSAQFTAGNVDVKINHNLKKTGVNYILARTSTANFVYTSPNDPNNAGYIVLRASGATNVNLLLF